MSKAETDSFEVVRASAKRYALGRYYAALFAPDEARDDLIALAAFVGEIERVGREVSDPALGEIRLAWWRDALVRGEATGNPVLDVFADMVRRRKCDAGEIETFFDAHAEALYVNASEQQASSSSLHAIDATPFNLAVCILGAGGQGVAKIVGEAARASGALRRALAVVRETPPAATEGARVAKSVSEIVQLAAEAQAALARVRVQLPGKSRELTTALLPLALIEPHFRALQRHGRRANRAIDGIAPLKGLWRIAYAHWTGRI